MRFPSCNLIQKVVYSLVDANPIADLYFNQTATQLNQLRVKARYRNTSARIGVPVVCFCSGLLSFWREG